MNMVVVLVIGCADPVLPSLEVYLVRRGEQVDVVCNETQQSWHLVCRNTQWIGDYGNCTDGKRLSLTLSLYLSHSFSLFLSLSFFSLSLSICVSLSLSLSRSQALSPTLPLLSLSLVSLTISVSASISLHPNLSL